MLDQHRPQSSEDFWPPKLKPPPEWTMISCSRFGMTMTSSATIRGTKDHDLPLYQAEIPQIASPAGRKRHSSIDTRGRPAGTGRRCRSWCRASWPAQGPSCPPAIHAAPHERAGCKGDDHTRPALPPGCPARGSQRHRPFYTVSLAGQRLKRSRPTCTHGCR